MKHSFLLFTIISLFIAIPTVIAQPPLLWDMNVGDQGADFFNDIQLLSDGSFIAAGGMTSGNGNTDAYLVKISRTDDVIWIRHSSDPTQDDWLNGLCICDDGGYVLAGNLNPQATDTRVARVNRLGQPLWSATYDVGGNDNAGSVVPSGDGGWFVGGTALGGTDHDFMLLKIDATGNEVWTQYFDSGYEEYGKSMILANDGNIIIAGDRIGPNGQQARITKIDPNGAILWDTYMPASSGANSVIALGGQYYGIAGDCEDEEGNMYIAILDENGNALWSDNFGGPGFQSAKDIYHDGAYGYILVGHTGEYQTDDCDGLIVKVSAQTGSVVWSLNVGTPGWDDLRSIAPIQGGWVVAGHGQFNGNDNARAMRFGLRDLINIDIDPNNYPFVIPANGGTFSFSGLIDNRLLVPQTADAWIDVQIPSGQVVFVARVTLSLDPGEDFHINGFVQQVPGYAPPGFYTYRAKIGNYPNYVAANDEIVFQKLDPNTQPQGSSDYSSWTLKGSFDQSASDDLVPAAVPMEYSLADPWPNPFNAVTTVEVALPEQSNLTVQVVDVTGRMVAELANGSFGPGIQRLSLDADGFASGVYFVRASVPGHLNQVRKVVLVR